MTLRPTQLTQASFFTEISNIAKCFFFDICNAEMAQSLSSLQKSEFLKLIPIIGIQLFNKNQMLQNGFFYISVTLRWHGGIKNHEIWTFKVFYVEKRPNLSIKKFH